MKCLFCENELEPKHLQNLNTGFDCQTCGRYAITLEFKAEFNGNESEVRKWAIEERVPLLKAIKLTNQSGDYALLKYFRIGAHQSYIGPKLD